MVHLLTMQDIVDHSFFPEDRGVEASNEILKILRLINIEDGTMESKSKLVSDGRLLLSKSLDKHCTIKGKGILFELIIRLCKEGKHIYEK